MDKIGGFFDKLTRNLVKLPTTPKPEDAAGREDEYSSDSSDGGWSRQKRVPKEDHTKWKKLELKNLGISFVFVDKDDSEATSQCGIHTMTMEERYTNMEGILSDDDFFASEIFEIQTGHIKFKDLVTVNVKLGKSISKRHNVRVKMLNKKVWTNEDVKFKSGKVEFKTEWMDTFVIVGELTRKKVKLPPEGTMVKLDEDSNISVTIPAGAVDEEVDVDFKLIPPDETAMRKYLDGENPVCKSVIGVTECLYGDLPSAFKFKKPVTVSLSFDDRPEMKEETALMMFRMNGRDIEIMEPAYDFALNEDGICNLEVTSFSGYFAGHIRSELANDKKTIIREVSMLFGSTYVATILMFAERENTSTGFPRLWIELVDKVKVEETVQKRTAEMDMVELVNSRSPDVVVYDGYRLRIDIVGNLQGIRGIPKSSYFITYLDVAADNHRLFTVERKGDGYTCIGIFNFHNDKPPSRRCVHSLQIDTIVGFKKPYRLDHRPDSGRKSSKMAGTMSAMSDFSGYASQMSISNDTDTLFSGPADDSRRLSVRTTDSIGSAVSLLEPVCPALSESSLYKLAEMVNDNGYKLAIELRMTDDFETNSVSSIGKSAVMCKTLKEWLKKQPDEEGAVRALSTCLKNAGLKKAAKAFDAAVKKKKSI